MSQFVYNLLFACNQFVACIKKTLKTKHLHDSYPEKLFYPNAEHEVNQVVDYWKNLFFYMVGLHEEKTLPIPGFEPWIFVFQVGNATN
jgi:hypothetical protein